MHAVQARARKHLSRIEEALAGSSRLVLATDADREGEAISWHLLQVLQVSFVCTMKPSLTASQLPCMSGLPYVQLLV